MVFTDAKTVTINNEEVQSIQVINGGYIYQNLNVVHGYSLNLITDKNNLDHSINESAILTATLAYDGVGVENEEITFYEQENYVNNLGTFSLNKPYYCCNFAYQQGYESSISMLYYEGSTLRKILYSVVGNVPKIAVTNVRTHTDEAVITLGKPILLIQNNQVYYYDTNNVLKQVSSFACSDIVIGKSNTYLYSYSKVTSDSNGNATYEYTSNSSDDAKIIAKWDELSKSQIIHNL